MNIKSLAIFIAVTLGLLVGVGAMLAQFGANADKPIADIAGESVHSKGTGAIKIVEFSDFQCPACLAVQAPFNQILKKYEGKVEVVYRHFPLSSIHKNAQIAAQAAVATGLQGKFWEMHDKLFTNQTIWASLADPREVFVGYAGELGIDMPKFILDMDSQAAKDVVAVDLLAASRYALTGTPTFYVNGVKTEFDKLDSKIESLLK